MRVLVRLSLEKEPVEIMIIQVTTPLFKVDERDLNIRPRTFFECV
jgi:hypothetical protein